MTDIKKTILMLSDFEFGENGDPLSGYSNIACSYALELYKYFNIVGLGISYRRNEHKMPFGITNVPINQIPSAIHSIFQGTNKNIKDILVLLDVPLQIKIFDSLKKPPEMKYYGIFAIEGDPLIFSWASELMKLDKRYAISEFGKKECEKVYVPTEHLIVPINVDVWYKRTTEEKIELKKQMGFEDKTVLFMNADSNERKNISAHFEALAEILKVNPKYHLILLTRKDSPVGWKYDDLTSYLGITGNVTIIDRGKSQQEIRKLYVVADYFVNCSKGEGLGMGILEAMSIGVPVIATNATSMGDLCADGRGILINPDFINIDVFGNTRRYYVKGESIAKAILDNENIDNSEMIEKSYQYILDRNERFKKFVEKMAEDINE